MIDYQEIFIKNLKEIRKSQGITQAKLAELCDVSYGTIGNLECGITKPSFDLILNIADKLQVSPEVLFHIQGSALQTQYAQNAESKTQYFQDLKILEQKKNLSKNLSKLKHNLISLIENEFEKNYIQNIFQ